MLTGLIIVAAVLLFAATFYLLLKARRRIAELEKENARLFWQLRRVPRQYRPFIFSDEIITSAIIGSKLS